MLILVFKSFQAVTPTYIYISALLAPRTNTQGLRAKNTSYGKQSFKFLAPKLWNTLDDDLRITGSIDHFRYNIDLSALCELS